MFVAENLSVLLYQDMENIHYTPMVKRGILRHVIFLFETSSITFAFIEKSNRKSNGVFQRQNCLFL